MYDDAWWIPAWSPDSRLIAYDTATNITMAAPPGRHQQPWGQGWFSPSWSDAGLITLAADGELAIDNHVLIGPLADTTIWGPVAAPS